MSTDGIGVTQEALNTTEHLEREAPAFFATFI